MPSKKYEQYYKDKHSRNDERAEKGIKRGTKSKDEALKKVVYIDKNGNKIIKNG